MLGRADPRLFDSHARSSFVGICAAFAGFGGRGMVASPQVILTLKLLLLGIRSGLSDLLTRFQCLGGPKSHASLG